MVVYDPMEASRWAKMESLSLNDQYQDEQDAAKPTKNTQQAPKTPSNPAQKSKAKSQEASNVADENTDSREAPLRAELETVKRMNQVIEGVTASLEKAKSNMNVCRKN